ncbi:hypothetical protein [Psychroserpens ponticola]|uniref:Lipoprotein n=1 Tax=Psychroserpens ponticola TaxID=2932268 RepID=A0ABY7RWX9_9FLAO|nr:hypothetical protein [Psychroserpens ponticola]WCO01646.1 hypothetical protein MUN68_016485 [Psychroserpens ponticola]
MKNYILILIILNLLCFNCKNETKNSSEITESEISKDILNDYDQKLLDYRKLDVLLNGNFKIEGFGMKKMPNGNHGFVFKLGDHTTNKIIDYYSIGLIGYSNESPQKPFEASLHPRLTTKQNNNYIILQRKIDKIRYFDSLDVYIYLRKNYKKSKRLGTVIIKDILFEDKK